MQTETQMRKQIHLTRRSPNYWRVTIDHPPLNIFGPDTIPQLDEVITAIETDEYVKVVVFDSAVDGFFLTHYDCGASREYNSLTTGADRAATLPDIPVRLSRVPVVSIASIVPRRRAKFFTRQRFARSRKAIERTSSAGAASPGAGQRPGSADGGRAPSASGADDIPTCRTIRLRQSLIPDVDLDELVVRNPHRIIRQTRDRRTADGRRGPLPGL
jgi:hypothetical protein